MRNDHPIAILLSTYNGARYLPAQLASLWGQTRQDFVVRVRDDGSTDGTPALLEAAVREHPGRVEWVQDGHRRLGPMRSFATLMASTQAPYAAFCDQDDVWLPHKLDSLLRGIQHAESEIGSDRPVLCCSDAAVTDAELRPLHPSYHARHDIELRSGRDLPLRRLLIRNFVIGATTMVNGALLARCRNIPDAAVMHDWWMALVATALGRVVVLPEALILYRQHGANAVGSRTKSYPRNWAEFRSHLDWARSTSARSIAQATAFAEQHAGELPAEVARLLQAVGALGNQGPVARLGTLVGSRVFKPGLALNLLHLYACATVRLGPQRPVM